jgi:hypothetical protein
MDLTDIQFIFNRAWSLSFQLKKWFFTFFMLLLCGVMIIFFRGLALHTGQWITLSLSFLPIFLSVGLLTATGIILIRIYHDEIKKRPFTFRGVIGKSWDVIVGTAYLSIPLILGFLLLWMMLGIFFLLNDLPGVGGLFTVILAFAPFLLNLGALFLCIVSLSMLFFVTPVVALRGMNRVELSKLLASRLQQNLFLNLVLATIAALPILLLSGLLVLAAFMTGAICYTCNEPLYIMLQWFFIMIPFTAALSPAIVFFFNFSAEAHVLLKHQQQVSR